MIGTQAIATLLAALSLAAPHPATDAGSPASASASASNPSATASATPPSATASAAAARPLAGKVVGIDPEKTNMSNVGRPIPLADRGANPVTEVIA